MNQNSDDSQGDLVHELLKARQQNREIAAQIDAILRGWCKATGHDYDELKARAAAMDDNDEPGNDEGLLSNHWWR